MHDALPECGEADEGLLVEPLLQVGPELLDIGALGALLAEGGGRELMTW